MSKRTRHDRLFNQPCILLSSLTPHQQGTELFNRFNVEFLQEPHRRRESQPPIRSSKFLNQSHLPEHRNQVALVDLPKNLIDFPLRDRLLKSDTREHF